MDAQLLVVWGHSVTWAQVLAAVALVLVAFTVGRLTARPERRPAPSAMGPSRLTTRTPSDDAFIKGLTHLMADHTDQAIEEFTRAVTLNSDTVETYVILGNLFRQKGEIERAVRIRQSIVARPNLDPAVKVQALYDLGLDYRKGGLFNRATEAFHDVLELDPSHVEAQQEQVSIFEETRDWERAFDSLRKLDRSTGSDSRRILAHYKTELGKEQMAAGKLDKAEDSLSQAIKVDSGCLDAYLHLGDLELARDRTRKALNVWRKAVRLQPVHAHLVVSRVAAAEEALGQRAVSDFLGEIDTTQAEVTTHLALAEYYHRHEKDDRALDLLRAAVEKTPSELNAHRLRGEILLARGDQPPLREAYGELLRQLEGDWATYQCGQCGFVSHQLTWKCPRCHHWDTMVPRG